MKSTKIILTIGEAFDVVVHIHVVDSSVVFEERELVGHANDRAAQLSVDHLKVFTPEMLKFIQYFRRQPRLEKVRRVIITYPIGTEIKDLYKM